jgi:hypothetical protein
MAVQSDKTGKRIRFIIAIGLSLLIVVIAALNIVVTDKNPLSSSLQDFGQWLSGVAGALAFIWLIVSYFQQGEELELQRDELAATREQLSLQKDEMARLADQAENQAISIRATEQHARRDTYMRLFDLGQSIQGTLVRSLDARLFRSRSSEIATRSGRDLYITFSEMLSGQFLIKPKHHIAIVGGRLVVSIWGILPNVYPEGYGWNEYSCPYSEVAQLLWFDEMLVREASLADTSGALVKLVEALPVQNALATLKQLLAEATDTPRPDKP